MAPVYSVFISSINEVLTQLGLKELEPLKLEERNTNCCNMPVNAVIGFEGDMKGNVVLGMENEVAGQMVRAMTMGIVNNICDNLGISALGELCNMIAGTASIKLSNIGINTLLTPPTIIIGEDLRIIVSRIKSKTVIMKAECGVMELDIGLWNKPA
ncbi:MAG: chemotaxis protein CheX [Tepidanaerobacteraceae bacterium]|nr:chemotaxis protein CheX [Tepidanaerobacteraceae bacterium]